MFVKVTKAEGLAHNGCFLADGEEAAVIDPRRDCMVYAQYANRSCVKIKYILETHRNEDYVSGSVELRNLTDAEIVHSGETPFEYGQRKLVGGKVFEVGDLAIKAVYTPGHTNDSLCYVVYDGSEGDSTQICAFTGDTLFAGGVGRTDLLGVDAWHTQAGKLHKSLRKKLLRLGDHVIVYPAHGSGSACGYEIGNPIDRSERNLGNSTRIGSRP